MPTIAKRVVWVMRAIGDMTGRYAWQFVALAVGLMLSVAILSAAIILRPNKQPRYRFETITFQRDGYTKQTVYKIDQETGVATEVVSSVKK